MQIYALYTSKYSGGRAPPTNVFWCILGIKWEPTATCFRRNGGVLLREGGIRGEGLLIKGGRAGERAYFQWDGREGKEERWDRTGGEGNSPKVKASIV